MVYWCIQVFEKSYKIKAVVPFLDELTDTAPAVASVVFLPLPLLPPAATEAEAEAEEEEDEELCVVALLKFRVFSSDGSCPEI